MSATRTKRPLPGFAKWSNGLWAFHYSGVDYFAARYGDGYCIVPMHDEDRIISQGPRKEAAVRAAMDRIDREGPDCGERLDAGQGCGA